MEVKISVLLPVYNSNPVYLKACIESILNQTFKDFELIILNDGSTVDVESVINSFKDNRIRYYKNQTNLGITKVRNHLLNIANSKYIAVADHDDISVPKRLEKEYNFLESHKEISLVSGWIEVLGDNTKQKIWKTKPFPSYLDFLTRCEIIHPACMWRKADFEKYDLKYEDGYYGVQDYDLFARAARYLNCANIQEVLLKYRKHESNASNQKNIMAFESEKVIQKMVEFLTSDKQKQKILYDYFAFEKARFPQNIFSIVNKHNWKILTILGIEIKLRRFKNIQKFL